MVTYSARRIFEPRTKRGIWAELVSAQLMAFFLHGIPIAQTGDPIIDAILQDLSNKVDKRAGFGLLSDLLNARLGGAATGWFEIGNTDAPAPGGGALRRGLVFSFGAGLPKVGWGYEYRDNTGALTGRFVYCSALVQNDPQNPANVWVAVAGGGGSAFNGARAITRPGQFQGLNVGGTTTPEFLDKLFFPAEPPLIGLQVNNPVRRFGSSTTVTLTYSVQAATNAITQIIVNGAARPVIQSGGGSVQASTPANTDTGFYASVTTGTENGSASASVVYRKERFTFLSALDLFSYADADLSAFVRQQSGEFATDRNQGRTFACAQQFIYFYWPDNFGAGSFSQNGLPSTAFISHPFTFTNSAGYTEAGRLTRSVSKQDGNQTVTVG